MSELLTRHLYAAVDELTTFAVAAHFTVHDSLLLLCRVVAEAINVDGVGVTFGDDINRFVHVTGQELIPSKLQQKASQSGPCRDAIETGSIVVAETSAQMKWPAFEELAHQAGIRSVMAVPLISRGRSWGALNLYWRAAHQISEDDRTNAGLLAQVAVSYLVLAVDRAESHKVQEQLARRALHDELTGLPNRGLLQELTYHALTSAKRTKTLVAVLFLDLDLFKSVNDTFGHQAGDQVLKVIARRIQNLLRESDTVGRLSGDEFLILCEDITIGNETQAQVLGLAEKIRTAILIPINLELLPSQHATSGRRTPVPTVTVSVSVGVALANEHHSGAELIHLADTAMYEAKTGGRNRTVMYPSGASFRTT